MLRSFLSTKETFKRLESARYVYERAVFLRKNINKTRSSRDNKSRQTNCLTPKMSFPFQKRHSPANVKKLKFV